MTDSTSPAFIKPTIGRVVLYHPARYMATGVIDDAPFAAIVTYVHDDRMVNLAVFSHVGSAWGVTSVPLIQGDDKPDDGAAYCEWMPYQKAVAAGAIAPTLHATDSAP